MSLKDFVDEADKYERFDCVRAGAIRELDEQLPEGRMVSDLGDVSERYIVEVLAEYLEMHNHPLRVGAHQTEHNRVKSRYLEACENVRTRHRRGVKWPIYELYDTPGEYEETTTRFAADLEAVRQEIQRGDKTA